MDVIKIDKTENAFSIKFSRIHFLVIYSYFSFSQLLNSYFQQTFYMFCSLILWNI
jgi:hypothetical protein